jgi:hypothetical protein
MVAAEPYFPRSPERRRCGTRPRWLQKISDVTGTKSAPRNCLFKCSNLERGESMKDPVSIFGCWRGFQFAGCVAALADQRRGGSIADFRPAGSHSQTHSQAQRPSLRRDRPRLRSWCVANAGHADERPGTLESHCRFSEGCPVGRGREQPWQTI